MKLISALHRNFKLRSVRNILRESVRDIATSQETPFVPYHLMMTYKNAQAIPASVLANWSAYHPNLPVRLYGNAECRDYLRQFAGAFFVEIFDFLQDGPIKADLFRIVYLYYEGGIYADVDMVVHENVDYLMPATDVFVTAASGYHYGRANPTFIATNKHNTLCRLIMEAYATMYRKAVPYDYWTYSLVEMIALFTDLGIALQRRISQPLLEICSGNDMHDFHIIDRQNGRRVFDSRGRNYDPIKHEFTS